MKILVTLIIFFVQCISFALPSAYQFNIVNNTKQTWHLASLPQTPGCHFSTPMTDIYSIKPNGAILSVRVNCKSDVSTGLNITYKNADSYLTLQLNNEKYASSIGIVPNHINTQLRDPLDPRKPNQGIDSSKCIASGCYLSVALLPPDKHILTLTLHGHFTPTNAAAYVQQITNNLSPQALKLLSPTINDKLISYSISANGEQLILKFSTDAFDFYGWGL